MLHVESSVLRFVQYDDEARELDIAFTSGKIYRYRDVPAEIYDELLEAESKGGYFNGHIKDQYLHSEVKRRSGNLGR
jgi:hypothetical protein